MAENDFQKKSKIDTDEIFPGENVDVPDPYLGKCWVWQMFLKCLMKLRKLRDDFN